MFFRKLSIAQQTFHKEPAIAQFQQKLRLQRYAENTIKTTELDTHITDISKSKIKSPLNNL